MNRSAVSTIVRWILVDCNDAPLSIREIAFNLALHDLDFAPGPMISELLRSRVKALVKEGSRVAGVKEVRAAYPGMGCSVALKIVNEIMGE